MRSINCLQTLLTVFCTLAFCIALHPTHKSGNLENHSSGDRTDSASAIPWSTLINYTTKDNSNSKSANGTSSYSYGPTVYYSPASYGQKSDASYSYYITSSSTASPPTEKTQVYYEDSPFAPATSSYVVHRKPTRTPSRFGTRTYFESPRHPYDDQESESNHPYQGFEKYKPQPSDDDYEFEDDNYGQSTKTSSSIRDPFGINRRRGHKDHNDQEKGDYEAAESEKVPYPPPWAYGYHKKHYPYPYGYDYGKLGYPGQDSGYGSLAFMLGLLPLGLMMAALVPNVVSMPVAAAAAAAAAAGAGTVAGRRRRAALTNLQFPILDSISKFGVKKLDDPTCLQQIFCQVAVEGRKEGANVVQKVFYRLMVVLDDNLVEKVGLKALFRAVKRDQCDAFPCGTSDSQKKTS